MLIANQTITRIEPQDFPSYSAVLSEYLEKIAIASDGAVDMPALQDGVLSGQFPLWVVINDYDVKAVAISPISDDLLQTCMIHVAGEDYKDWTGDLLQRIKQWAFDNGSKRVAVIARTGWEKILSQNGMKKTHIVMEIK